MSRPRKYAEQAEAKRLPLDLPDDDDPDESEWDDVSGYSLEPRDEEGEQQ